MIVLLFHLCDVREVTTIMFFKAPAAVQDYMLNVNGQWQQFVVY